MPPQSSRFKGIKLEELSELEKLFEVNIVVYSLQREEKEEEVGKPEVTAHLIQRSHRHYSSTMNLNLYKNHFSYIKNVNRYSKSFQCTKCSKYWRHRGMLHRQ